MASLLHISDAATLALHTGAMLAYHHPNRVSTHTIAVAFNASEAHLSKVLQRLARNGIVRSIRGPRGGFTLNKAPQEISLLLVYEAIDGPIDSRTCLLGTPICNGNKCLMDTLLSDMYFSVKSYLSSHSLHDIASFIETIEVKLPAADAAV